MSAFLFTPDEIGALAAFAERHDNLAPQSAVDRATAWARENLRSVSYRYSRDDDETAGDCGYPTAAAYITACVAETLTAPTITAEHARDRAGSLIYQSCEHPEWHDSEAKRLLERLQHVAGVLAERDAAIKAKAAAKRPPRKVHYFSVTDTAKLIRKALKAEFPRVKFSVRSDSYAGGASVRISWTDGPTVDRVDAIVKPFESKSFDGMIDMAISKRHWLLPDGSVVLAETPGTEGSKGVIPAHKRGLPHDDAQLVHFGADYVFTERRYSRAFMETAARKVAAEYGAPVPEIEEWSNGAYIRSDNKPWINNGHQDAAWYIMREIQKQNGPLHK